MANVADDRDRQVFELLLVLTNRENVEEPLSRMRYVRFAGVQNTGRRFRRPVVQERQDIADERFDDWHKACTDINNQIAEDIVRGMYLFREADADESTPRVQLLGSGTILHEVIAAADENDMAMVFTSMRHFRH